MTRQIQLSLYDSHPVGRLRVFSSRKRQAESPTTAPVAIAQPGTLADVSGVWWMQDMTQYGSTDFTLTDEHRMLLRMRDTLYEGSWEDFRRDLCARANHEPHVFETIPDTPGLEDTIKRHLALIAEMRDWEVGHRRLLKAD